MLLAPYNTKNVVIKCYRCVIKCYRFFGAKGKMCYHCARYTEQHELKTFSFISTGCLTIHDTGCPKPRRTQQPVVLKKNIIMKDFLKYGAIGLLCYAGMRYYKAYKLGSKLNISFASIMANGINKNNFSIGVNINVENKSGDNITLSNSNLKCYINGRYVGNCVVPYTQIIKANSTTKIFVVCDVMYKSAFADWWPGRSKIRTTHLTTGSSAPNGPSQVKDMTRGREKNARFIMAINPRFRTSAPSPTISDSTRT